MGLEISKVSSYSFHKISVKLYVDITCYGGIRAITFLAISQVLKFLCHFQILTWESMGKSLTVQYLENRWCTAKRIKNLGAINSYCTCGVLFMSDSITSVWGHFVHFAKFPVLRFSKGGYSRSFSPISIKLYCKYIAIRGNTRYYFLAICQFFKIYESLNS